MNWYIIIVIFVWVVLVCVGILALFGTYILIRRMLLWLQKEKKNDASQPTPKQRGALGKQSIEWNVSMILIIVLVAATVFIGGAIATKYLWDFEVENSEIVLTFVGILATFVVVTNYAQVTEIKRDLHNRMLVLERWKRTIGNKWTNTDKFDKRPNTNTLPPAQPARPMAGKPNNRAQK